MRVYKEPVIRSKITHCLFLLDRAMAALDRFLDTDFLQTFFMVLLKHLTEIYLFHHNILDCH